MKISRVPGALLIAAVGLSGCAKSASNVTGAYQSPSLYASWSCQQLNAEENEVRRRVVVLADKQNDAATRDAVAMGVGLVLFWPALFVLAAGDDETQLSVMKGQHDALVAAQGAKQCAATPTATVAATAGGMTAPAAPAISGPRPVEGVRLSAFSAEEMNAYCGQAWEKRVAADGRTEFNPCHRKGVFL